MVFYDVVYSIPSLRDLYQLVTPHYATEWREIGILLGLPNERLKIIKADNPRDIKRCCNQMFQAWLQTDTSASWEKLFAAIESDAVTSQSGTGMQLEISTVTKNKDSLHPFTTKDANNGVPFI